MLHIHRKKCLEMEKQLKKANKQKFSEGLLIGAALGVAAGAIAGLLLAPQSGRDTLGKVSSGMKSMCDKCMAMMPNCCCFEEDEDDFASDFEDAHHSHEDHYHETFSQEEAVED